jgi:syntaxin 5
MNESNETTMMTRTTRETDERIDRVQMASAIGHGIHRTSLKLERLNQLAKASSLYDDKSREIAETSAVIKLDIQALNESIVELQSAAARTRERGETNKSVNDHSGTVVDTLKNRLATATKTFKETLTTRQANMKAGEERRAMFGASAGPSASDPSLGYLGDDAFSRAMRSAPGGFGNLQSGGIGGSAHDFVPRPGAPGQGMDGPMQTQGQMQLNNQNNAYMDSRQEALQNVERTITELGGIFQQLATMVSEQGELAIRIDENVDDTLANVDNAQTQLLKYLNSVSSNRWLIMKIFAVLISFFSFFIIFVA